MLVCLRALSVLAETSSPCREKDKAISAYNPDITATDIRRVDLASGQEDRALHGVVCDKRLLVYIVLS